MIRIETINGTTTSWYEGPPITTERDAIDVIGYCYGQEIEIVVFPAALLPDDFFWLSTGLAGAVLQKFQNYGFRVGIVGDLSRFTAESSSLRDFIYESNKRGQMLFVPDRATLEARL